MILMYFDKANVIQIMTFFMYSKSVTMPVMRIVEFAVSSPVQRMLHISKVPVVKGCYYVIIRHMAVNAF